MDKYYNKLPKIYLTGGEVSNMQDDQLVGVNRIAINSRITELQIQGSKDKEAIKILQKATRKIKEKEKRTRPVILWGCDMSVKDVKIAFENLDKMPVFSFKKIMI